jgi:hypothetical protein
LSHERTGSRGGAGRNEEIRVSVEERPEIKAKIEERIRNLPAEKRERAFINAVKTEVQSEAMRPNGLRP